MRIFILFLMLVISAYAVNSIEFFEKSPKNRLLCHLGQYSFKVVSQENAVIEDLRGHQFFKLKDENLYFFNTACQPLEQDKSPIIF